MARTVMIVDDSATMRMMVVFTLQEAGYTMIEAVSGTDAFEKLEKNDVDMIIADLHMPQMDGITLVKMIRSHKDYHLIPIVILTTEDRESIREQGREAGATGWMVKPFKPEQLVAITRKVLE
ncbi:MAG: response regulator [bacterium]|nr:response regulator [bacterium]MDT8395937.1 response regulator [bacterium]